MRLGGFHGARDAAQLDALCEKLDALGLSAISAPGRLLEMDDDECAAYGEAARARGLVVGEAGMWQNLLTDDASLRAERIERVRALLRKAERMGCRCVVSLVGTKDPSDSAAAPHPYLYTDDCKREFREVVLRILDGLDLRATKYVIEPWHNSFFYQPEEIRGFLDAVAHPALGLHLDQMNMVSQPYFYNTSELIRKTFDLLAPDVVSVHLKDVRWDHRHLFLKWDEVLIGDGVLDYGAYLTRLGALPPDTPCYCEHLKTEAEYAENFARAHAQARKAGVRFLTRRDPLAGPRA
ncbi:MAG: sugar phosphate isomerase/epimerase [Planctomycetota bacterium]|nr:sugar phosphate isomerase/epimerase [Planctomycetota bacterium]